MANSGPNGAWRRDDWKPRLPIVGFIVWYGDGSVFSSAHGDWEDAPREGVQVIRFFHPDGFTTMTDGFDEYVHPGKARTLLGAEIEYQKYEQILKAARADSWRPAA